MLIPFMRLDRQFADLKSDIMQQTEAVLSHGRVLQGPEVSTLEERLAEYHQVSHAVAVGSGTDALTIGLKALGLKPGGRVAVTAFSFVASASAIALAGGIPVFVDIDENYLTDREQLLSLIRNKQIDGLIAVHLYGQMMDLDEIYAEAKANDIFVIEDAAQCLGATRSGKTPGHCSDITCLSFDPTKGIGAYGSGGAALTQSDDLAEKLARLRYHGHVGNRIYEEIGFNTQLPSIQAAWISVKLDHLEEWTQKRIDIAERFTRTLHDLPNIQVPSALPNNVHIFHKYVLQMPNRHRNALEAFLKEKGIGTSIHYANPLHQQPCFSKLIGTPPALPNAERAAQEVLSLPIYPELTDDEVAFICQTVRQFAGQFVG